MNEINLPLCVVFDPYPELVVDIVSWSSITSLDRFVSMTASSSKRGLNLHRSNKKLVSFREQQKQLPVNGVNLIGFLLLPEPDGGERILRDLVWDAPAAVSLLPIYVDQPFQHLPVFCQYSPVIGANNWQWSDYKTQITNLPSEALFAAVHCSVFTVLRMMMNNKDLGNSKDSVPASEAFRVEWLHFIFRCNNCCKNHRSAGWL